MCNSLGRPGAEMGSIINVGVARLKGQATPNIFRYYQEKA